MFDRRKLSPLLVLLVLLGAGHASTLYVSSSGSNCQGHAAFSSIQAAIDNASEGDTVFICSGPDYVENVAVNKSVVLEGEDNLTTIIADIPSNPVLSIESDNVSIYNLVLKDATGSYGLYSTASHCTVSSVVATNNDIGFYFLSSSHNNITGNTARDNFDEGFRLISISEHNLLKDNLAYNQQYYGFYLHSSSHNRLISNTAYNSTSWYGFFLYSESRNNTLINNTAFLNAHHGFHVYRCTENNLSGNLAYDNLAEGFRLSYSSLNTLAGNTAINNRAEGFRLSSGSENLLEENTAHDNSQNGFLVSSSSANNLTSNTAHENGQYGFHIHLGVGNRLVSNRAREQEDGFRIFGGERNHLASNKAYENNVGIYLDISSFNSLESNSAYDNLEHGFLLSSSSNNTLQENIAHSNGQYGFYTYLSSENSVESNTARDNFNGFRVSSSSGNTLAGNQAFDNRNIGINLYLGSKNILGNNTVNDNGFRGIHLHESPDNTLEGNTARDNRDNGINVYLSSGVLLDNNSAFDNGAEGILVSSSLNSTLLGNAVYDNRYDGISLSLSPGALVSGNKAYSNGGYGLFVSRSTRCTVRNLHLYENRYDMDLRALSSSADLRLSGILFDNPSGSLGNYTNISLYDELESNRSYSLTWSGQPAPLPHPYISFENKHLEIKSEDNASIDHIVWHWLDEETDGKYLESKFELWQHDEDGWTRMGAVPDTENNTLSLSNLAPQSTYSILQNRSGPALILNHPSNREMFNATSLNLSWTVYSYDSEVLCDLVINNETVNGAGIYVSEGAPFVYPVDMPGDGEYFWNVTCRDTISTNTSETRSFIVDLPPSVSLISPCFELINSTAYGLEYVARDNSSAELECSVLLDGLPEDFNDSVQAGEASTFCLSGIPEGSHFLHVECTDDAGNTALSESKEILVDVEPPRITLVAPENGYTGNDSRIVFNFTVWDDFSENITSYLLIDGEVQEETSGGQVESRLLQGPHNWSIRSVDEAGNPNTSEERTILLDHDGPDILLYSPSNGQVFPYDEATGVRFNFTAMDDESDLVLCSFYLDSELVYSDMPVLNGEPESFVRTLDVGHHTWRLVCRDEVNNTVDSPLQSFRIGTQPGEEDDDSDSDPEPEISIHMEQVCPGDRLVFTVSSGFGTRLRLLDGERFLVDSNLTDVNGQASFDFAEEGRYEIRASKDSFGAASGEFIYNLCNVGVQDSPDENGGEEHEETAAEDAEPECPENEQPEEEPEADGGIDKESPGKSPDAEIEAEELVYLGDDVLVKTWVNGVPSRVLLLLVSPDDEREYLFTNVTGEIEFPAEKLGTYRLWIAEPELPRKGAEVEVVKRSLSGYSKPAAFAFLACLPFLLLLLVIFVSISYLAVRETRNGSRRNYRGFRRKRWFSRLRRVLGLK
ncbi:hypothetical protein GF318_01215 [Candidatus Micrarchaeota archaeon]|nr:hypothetical protein [Candidatus Micrarchaeota archaeon]